MKTGALRAASYRYPRPMRWLVFGTYDKGRHPRVGVMIEGLRAAGDGVVEVNTPLDLDTAARVELLRQPWRIPFAIGRLAKCWIQLARRSSGTDVDAVLVGYFGHLDVRLARTLFRRTPIVLDHLISLAGTAADRGLATPRGPMERTLAAIDRGAIRAADLVVVDTEEHAAVAELDKVVVVAVGAEDDWFAARPAGPANLSRGGLRVVFFGLFTALHGTATLGRALGELAGADIEFTIIGTGQDSAECRRLAAGNAKVTWLDWVSRAELPALVAAHDVCLGIFGTTDKAGNVVPTKVYQGAAAGCAIVTADTGPQRRVLKDAAAFVPAGNSSALADVLRQLAADPPRLAELRSAAACRADSAFRAVSVVAPLRDRLALFSANVAVRCAQGTRVK